MQYLCEEACWLKWGLGPTYDVNDDAADDISKCVTHGGGRVRSTWPTPPPLNKVYAERHGILRDVYQNWACI